MGHDINRALKCWGANLRPQDVTTQHFVALRQTCIEAGAAVSTVESTIATVWTLLRFLKDIGQLESVPSKGRVMRRPAPLLRIPTVDEFDKLYRQADVALWPRIVWNRREWWEGFLAMAYFTGLRRSDLLAFRWDWIDDRGRIVMAAEKTGKRHVIPVHPVLARHLSFLPRIQPRVFVAARSSLKQLRRELNRMSEAAGVRNITPQNMRQLAANVWERARPGCGLLIQGSGFRGSARHYLDPSIQLEAAVGELEVPPAMLQDGKQLRLF